MDSDIGSGGQGKTLAGTRLGKYQVGSEIGQGGMGKVYKGYDPTLDRYVALKVMAPHLTWEEEFVERFLREARSAARLRHPNIVTIYDVGRDRGWYYFSMDYVEGKTVAQLIKERGRTSIQDALQILRPLASALDYAHEQGLVHRDIKPSNVVVGDDGHVTLMDFGIARASQTTRLTRSGAVMGTPEYMAPEQARGDDVDRRTDQYALGVIAYEMLVGKAPFQAESTPTLLYKIVHEGPPPLHDARPDLPRAATTALNQALAKEREHRYPTCTAFVDGLEQAGQEAQAPARPSTRAPAGVPTHTPARPPARPSRAEAVPEPRSNEKHARSLLGLGGIGLLLAGVLCLGLAAVGVITGLIALGGASDASHDATDTAAARQPVTVTRYVSPTNTSQPPSATPRMDTPVPPTDTPSPLQDAILFEEDFENPWSGWEIGEYEGGSLKTEDGVYVVTSAGELKWMWGVADLFFTDAAIEVDATQVQAGPADDNDYGIGCRMQPGGDGYHLLVSGDGFYGIYLRADGSFVPLIEFQKSDVVRQGNATNRIRAVCDGSRFSLWVNDRLLATADDTTYSGGDIALMTTSYEDAPSEIRFDNLVVYEPGG